MLRRRSGLRFPLLAGAYSTSRLPSVPSILEREHDQATILASRLRAEGVRHQDRERHVIAGRCAPDELMVHDVLPTMGGRATALSIIRAHWCDSFHLPMRRWRVAALSSLVDAFGVDRRAMPMGSTNGRHLGCQGLGRRSPRYGRPGETEGKMDRTRRLLVVGAIAVVVAACAASVSPSQSTPPSATAQESQTVAAASSTVTASPSPSSAVAAACDKVPRPFDAAAVDPDRALGWR